MGTLQETHYGVVTNNNDPEKRGRLKVKCQSIVGANTELPDWAECCSSIMVGKAGSGALWLPNVGATVELTVDVHDTKFDEMPGERFLQNPSIKWRPSGYTDNKGPQKLPDALATNYPHRRGMVTPGGHMIIFDDKGSVIIRSKDGASIELKPDGSIVLSSPVLLGTSATELMVLGNQLLTWLNSHTHGTGVGPTSTPITPATTAILSATGNKVT